MKSKFSPRKDDTCKTVSSLLLGHFQVGPRRQRILKVSGKLRNSLGTRTEPSTPAHSAFPDVGSGGQRGRLPRADNSCHKQLGLGHAICPASCPFSVVPALSVPQGQGHQRPPSSPPLWCLQPGGGSDPQQLTQHRHCLSHCPRTHHGPRGRFAAQQRRRRRQPRRLSTASLTTATTAQDPEKPSPPTAGESRAPPQITLAIDKLQQQLWRARGGGRSW